jgi:hypothetical protein
MNVEVIEEFVHPDDQEKTRAALQDMLVNGTNGGTQYRHRHKTAVGSTWKPLVPIRLTIPPFNP